MSDTWMRFRPVPQPRLRVLSFAFAGGAAQAFRPFAMGLAADVELLALQLPGRWNRIKEPPFVRMGPLADEVARSLPSLDVPTVFFGYSLGAIVAFEVAHRLREAGSPLPKRLLLASRGSPDLPSQNLFSDLADDAFVRQIDARYGGIPDAVKNDPELLAMMLPALRADMQALEHYEHQPRAPLSVPLTLWAGTTDRTLNEQAMAGWAQHAALEGIEWFPGGHFFLFPPTPALIEKVRSSVEK